MLALYPASIISQSTLGKRDWVFLDVVRLQTDRRREGGLVVCAIFGRCLSLCPQNFELQMTKIYSWGNLQPFPDPLSGMHGMGRAVTGIKFQE